VHSVWHANVAAAREQWIASPERHTACTRRATSGAAAPLSHLEIPYRSGRNAALQPQSRQLLRPQQKQHIMQTLTCMLDCPPQTTMSPKRTLCSCTDTPPLVTTASLGLRDGGTNGSTTDHPPSVIDAFVLYDPAWYPACGQVSANASGALLSFAVLQRWSARALHHLLQFMILFVVQSHG
jgi:hypothetical protein